MGLTFGYTGDLLGQHLTKLWAKIVNHSDVFDNLWSRKMAVSPQMHEESLI